MNKINIKVFEKYITNKREATFNRIVDIEEPIVQEMLALNLKDWKKSEAYLEKIVNDKGYQKYALCSISRSGDKLSHHNLVEINYKGYRYEVTFKGVDFVFECLNDGTINRAYHNEHIFFNCFGWRDVYISNDIEKMYQSVIKEIKESREKARKYYNKEIRELRKAMKWELEKHDKVLNYEELKNKDKDIKNV